VLLAIAIALARIGDGQEHLRGVHDLPAVLAEFVASVADDREGAAGEY